MVKREAEWDLYRTFLAVIRERTLSAAARKLGLAQPTAGRHIHDLETTLEISLFVRSKRGLVPTPAALAIVPYAEAMSAAAAGVHRLTSAELQEERGVVRLTAGQLIAHEVLPAVLADFSHRFPQIELELSVSDQNEDLLGRAADIAVRMLRPTQGALIARRIGSVEVGLFAHRHYVQTFGMPESPQDMSAHRIIGFDHDAHGIRSAGGTAAQLRREQFGFRCDNAAVQIAALHAGIGIAGYHIQLARRHPSLIRVLEKQFRFKREMWLAIRRDARAVRRIRLLFDHLGSALAGYIKDGGHDQRLSRL